MRFLKRLKMTVLLGLVPLLFAAGCMTGDLLGSIARSPEIEELISGYMKEKKIPGEFRDVTMIADRPAQDYSYLTDYGKGEWVTKDGTIYFACNIETGEIYTSERNEEFKEACLNLIMTELGLNPEDCEMELRFTYDSDPVDLGEEYGERSQYLGRVLPVDIEDMESYAREALESENVSISAKISCLDESVSAEQIAKENDPDWIDTSVELTDASGESVKIPEKQ